MTAAAVPASPDRLVRGATALLRDRNFWPFFGGNLASNLGTWFHNLTASIVVFDQTGSAFMVGILVAAQFGAVIFVTLWAGALADRVSRRNLLITTQLAGAVWASTLAVWIAAVGAEDLGPWPIIGMSSLIGIGFAISIPAMQALVPELVPADDLEQALALNSITFNLARAVGPALAATVLVLFGPAPAFGLNAVSYLVFVGGLGLVRPRPRPLRPAAQQASVRHGLRFVRHDRDLTLMIVAVASLGFAVDPVSTLVPALSEDLGGGEALVGALVSAFGVGSILTALCVGRLRRRYSQETLASIGLALCGMGMLLLAASPVAAVAVASLTIAGSGFLVAITALTARIYRRVPDELRGRVLALWGVAFIGSRPIAAVVDGAVADRLSLRAAIAMVAAVAVVAAWLVRPSSTHRPG